jgi:surfactin synthase thioesterase subunit
MPVSSLLFQRYALRMPARSQPKLRFVMLHHAGGSAASFIRWSEVLPADWEGLALDLPGRRASHAESALESLEDCVQHLQGVLADSLDLPLVIFGHSMGSTLGFELTRSLIANGRADVRAFVPSARMPAHYFAEHHVRMLHRLPRAELLQELTAMGGLPTAYLRHRDAIDILEQLVRADLKLIETYHPSRPLQTINVPIWPLGGIRDHCVTYAGLKAWQDLSRLHKEPCLFAGGHFYLDQEHKQVVRYIEHNLRQLAEKKMPEPQRINVC